MARQVNKKISKQTMDVWTDGYEHAHTQIHSKTTNRQTDRQIHVKGGYMK